MRAKFAERERFKELELKRAEAHASMWFGVVTAETMDMVKNDADKAERAGSQPGQQRVASFKRGSDLIDLRQT